MFSLALGQNLEEFQKLQQEYRKALERQSLNKSEEISNAENAAKSTSLPDKLVYTRRDIESLLANTEKLLIELKFLQDSSKKMPNIGYEIFTKRDSIPFWQNLPLSKDYKLGPGDEIIISLWGESNSSNTETINRDGQVFIEKIGMLNLGGKTLDSAREYLLSKYSKVYSTLVGDNPKSFIDLTLGELKSVNVHFLGHVNVPGVHMIHPFSTVITGLIQAGGVNQNGSLREISILRNNKIIKVVDIYDYFMNGKTIKDLRLIDQDIVFVQSRKSKIPITGEILRKGYYEILDNENLSDLISFAGSYDNTLPRHVLIFNNKIIQKKISIADLNNLSKISIIHGDSVHVLAGTELENFVIINGQIKNPGKYPYYENLLLKNLIEATMSTIDPDFSKTMNLSKIYIFRKNNQGPKPLKLTVSIDDSTVLRRGDRITVSKNNIMQPIQSVVITGEIISPGIYPVNNQTSLSEILNLSGGLTNFALEKGIEVYRDSIRIGWENENFILNNGDSLNVIKKSGLVFVRGEVNVPGYVTFKKNKRINFYIKKAGGFSQFADKKITFT